MLRSHNAAAMLRPAMLAAAFFLRAKVQEHLTVSTVNAEVHETDEGALYIVLFAEHGPPGAFDPACVVYVPGAGWVIHCAQTDRMLHAAPTLAALIDTMDVPAISLSARQYRRRTQR